jgi:hypothetical protein
MTNIMEPKTGTKATVTLEVVLDDPALTLGSGGRWAVIRTQAGSYDVRLPSDTEVEVSAPDEPTTEFTVVALRVDDNPAWDRTFIRNVSDYDADEAPWLELDGTGDRYDWDYLTVIAAEDSVVELVVVSVPSEVA